MRRSVRSGTIWISVYPKGVLDGVEVGVSLHASQAGKTISSCHVETGKGLPLTLTTNLDVRHCLTHNCTL